MVIRIYEKGMAKDHPFTIESCGGAVRQRTCILRPWNRTVPSFVANRVKSLPMPTLEPAKNFVPHCLMITEPAFTASPPNCFTPR